jgi:hypothetical protein
MVSMCCRLLFAFPLTFSLALLSGVSQHSMTPPAAVDALPDLWRYSDAVSFLRIQNSEIPRLRNVGGTEPAICTEHHAKVLETFKRFIGEPHEQLGLLEPLPARTAEADGSTAGPACRPGEDCVAFLHWNGFEQRFQAHLLLPVRDGQVTSRSVQELRSGVKIAALLTILRSFQE